MRTIRSTIWRTGMPALASCILAFGTAAAIAAESDDRKAVADLDTQYQLAVKNNDAATMNRILADDFVLVTGRGKTYNKADLLKSASGSVVYEHQEDTDQTVRVWGDTAVVTALLWVKGTDAGKPFDYKLWFSDTYVRTAIIAKPTCSDTYAMSPTNPVRPKDETNELCGSRTTASIVGSFARPTIEMP